jgi:hypothetical protein
VRGSSSFSARLVPIKCCCNGELNNTVTRVRSSVTGKLSQDTRLLCCMKPGSLRETATLALPEGATLKRLDLASPYSNPCLSLAISVTWRPFPFGLTTMLSVSSFDLKSWFFHIFFGTRRSVSAQITHTYKTGGLETLIDFFLWEGELKGKLIT